MFPRVLIVDDTPVDRHLIKGLLAADDFIETEFAEDGIMALELVDRDLPRLVLADLVMPRMDGLAFVRELHRRVPSLPIVLMTAHGSGTTALEALRSGAASYIPKAQMADRLLSTVHRLLGMTRDESNQQLLCDYQNEIRYGYSLPNKPVLIDAILGLVHKSTASIHFGNSCERLQMGVALEQALLNAIYRGNLEVSHDEMAGIRQQGAGPVVQFIRQRLAQPRYANRRVHLEIEITRERVRFCVRDDGNGFDTTTVPNRDDPTEIDRAAGQGLVLMANLMDEVNFNAIGNEVELIKYAAPTQQATFSIY